MLTKIWTQLKTFGLDYDDFPTMIDNIGLFLWILTINIQKKWTQSKYDNIFSTTSIKPKYIISSFSGNT